MKPVYAYSDYKDYLNQALSPTGPSRGLRSKLAKFLNCQTGYISQVLKGHQHFTVEHCLRISEFLGLSKDQQDYFMILVQKGRAGSQDLEDYYSTQMAEILKARESIKSRMGVDEEISEKEYNIYFSHWYYQAVHILTSIPQYQTPQAISEKLGLKAKLTSEILAFLTSKGLVEEVGGNYKIGKTRIHLPDDSSMVTKHHSNWRIEAIKSLSEIEENDLHFSGVLSLSKSDFLKIKNILLQSLEDVNKILEPSQEEELTCLNLDWFKL